jgi:hypothetical protein
VTVVCLAAAGFGGMKSSTRPRPLPPDGDTFTAFTLDGTTVQLTKHPDGDVVTSTKYTAPWVGTTSAAKYWVNGIPSLGDGDRNVMVVDSVQVEFMPAGGEGEVDELQADEIREIEQSAIASLKVKSLV